MVSLKREVIYGVSKSNSGAGMPHIRRHLHKGRSARARHSLVATD
jgi:hypothetical protein